MYNKRAHCLAVFLLFFVVMASKDACAMRGHIARVQPVTLGKAALVYCVIRAVLNSCEVITLSSCARYAPVAVGIAFGWMLEKKIRNIFSCRFRLTVDPLAEAQGQVTRARDLVAEIKRAKKDKRREWKEKEILLKQLGKRGPERERYESEIREAREKEGEARRFLKDAQVLLLQAQEREWAIQQKMRRGAEKVASESARVEELQLLQRMTREDLQRVVDQMPDYQKIL